MTSKSNSFFGHAAYSWNFYKCFLLNGPLKVIAVKLTIDYPIEPQICLLVLVQDAFPLNIKF